MVVAQLRRRRRPASQHHEQAARTVAAASPVVQHAFFTLFPQLYFVKLAAPPAASQAPATASG